jgi:mevalonate kinase
MKKIKVSAPGKIHLLGEHAVVYGKPALLAAINKRVFVEIIATSNKKKEVIINSIQDEKVIDYIKHAIDVTVKYYKQQLPSGFTLSITSKIPPGAGMGSSAASAVAIAGAVTLFLGQAFDKKIINEIALLIEKYNHVNPSGGDNSTSCYGGFIWFRRETSNFKIIEPLSLVLSKEIKKNIYIIDTGKSKETTGEMVKLVKQFIQKNKKNAEKIFNDQEELTKNLLSAFSNNDENQIKLIIKKGQRNLEKLGVVPAPVKKMIRHIEKLGGAAKICGGGGISNATGVLLVYQNNKINSIYQSLSLGAKGITIHE